MERAFLEKRWVLQAAIAPHVTLIPRCALWDASLQSKVRVETSPSPCCQMVAGPRTGGYRKGRARARVDHVMEKVPRHVQHIAHPQSDAPATMHVGREARRAYAGSALLCRCDVGSVIVWGVGVVGEESIGWPR